MEGMLTYSQMAGTTARVEAGYHPLDPLALFGFAQWNNREGTSAGVGVRLNF